MRQTRRTKDCRRINQARQCSICEMKASIAETIHFMEHHRACCGKKKRSFLCERFDTGCICALLRVFCTQAFIGRRCNSHVPLKYPAKIIGIHKAYSRRDVLDAAIFGSQHGFCGLYAAIVGIFDHARIQGTFKNMAQIIRADL